MDQPHPFILRDILLKAWTHTRDTKAAVWTPAILSIVLSFIISFIVTAIFRNTLLQGDGTEVHPVAVFIAQLVSALIVAAVVAPFITGMLMVAIARSRGETIAMQQGLQYTPSWLKLAGINMIIAVFAMILDLFFSVVLALIIPAGMRYSEASTGHAIIGNGFVIGVGVLMFLCYLVFYAFMVFAMPISVDKQKSAWDAISSACRAVQPHWIKMLGLEINVTIIMIITLIPFSFGIYSPTTWVPVLCGVISLILLIWSLPLIILMHGEAYHRLVD